jgi:hypothetical protein
MVDYKEILRLAANPGYSQRQIAVSVGSSHHTVKEVLETACLFRRSGAAIPVMREPPFRNFESHCSGGASHPMMRSI